MPHFYCPPDNISTDGKFILSAEEARHLIKVLRKKTGDVISIFDGKGNSYKGRITDVFYDESEKKYLVSGRIISEETEKHDGPLPENFDINFYQALTKKQKIEDVIDKLAQIGISSVTPILTRRTIVKIHKSDYPRRLKRWNEISLSASKQSGRKDILRVKEILDFREAIDRISESNADSVTIIAWEWEKENNLRSTVHRIADKFSATVSLNVFIGPEGGFHPDEIEYAAEKLKDKLFTVGLGKNILRADTAAVMLASVLVYETR